MIQEKKSFWSPYVIQWFECFRDAFKAHTVYKCQSIISFCWGENIIFRDRYKSCLHKRVLVKNFIKITFRFYVEDWCTIIWWRIRHIKYKWKLENVSAKVKCKSQQPKTINRKVGTLIKKNHLAIVTWCANMNFNSICNSSLIKILLGNANRHWANNFIYLSGTLQLSNASYTLVTSNKESEGKSQAWSAAVPQWPLAAQPATYGCFAFPWRLQHISVEVQGLDGVSRCTGTFVLSCRVQGAPHLRIEPIEKGHGLDDTHPKAFAACGRFLQKIKL